MSEPIASLHIHTDVAFFAGCERMLPILWSDPLIVSNYRISFSFGYSPRYAEEVRPFLRSDLATYPIRSAHRTTADRILAQNGKSPRDAKIGRKLLRKVALLLAFYPAALIDVYRFHSLMRDLRPTVVHLNNGGYPGSANVRAAAVGARLAGCRSIIMVVNNLAFPYTSPGRWIDIPLDFAVRLSVSRFVTASTAASEKLQRVLNLPDSRICSIQNAVADPRLPPHQVMPPTSAPLQKTFRVGVVALLEERKGHQVLLDALAILREANLTLFQGIHVEFVGDGNLREFLEAKVTELHLRDCVYFVGYVKNALPLVATYDAVVLPSIALEDSPFATIEAMALGKPVIASRLAGLEEQVEHGVTGFLIEPGDAYGLSEKLEQLAGDEELLAAMGAKARERWWAHHNPDAAAAKYLRIYQDVVGSGEGG